MIEKLRFEPLDPGKYTAFRRLFDDSNNKICLALGGGAVPGLCGNVALVHFLEELGLRDRVDSIWGTSAGAIVAAGWATGTKASEIYRGIASLDRRGALDVRWFELAKSFLLRFLGAKLPDALVRGRAFRRTIDAGLAVKTFEECSIPLRCIACESGEKTRTVIFDEGPLLPAILDSIAIPGILAPAGKRDYYDGGLVEKTPLLSPIAEHLRQNDGKRLVIVCTHYRPSAHRGRVRGFIERFMTTMYVLEDLTWALLNAKELVFRN